MQKSLSKLLSLADVFSLTNALFGFLAILLLFSNLPYLAITFIFLGLLADGLDGIIARRTRKGKIGEYLEAIADMISLSVAPLALLFVTYSPQSESNLWLHGTFGIILCCSFLCSVLRLSSFSFLKEDHVFVGLPTSVSALFIILFTYLHLDLLYVLPFVLILSLAMVSPLRYPKLGMKIDGAAAVLILLVLIFGTTYNNIAPLLLFVAIILYSLFGPFYVKLRHKKL